MVTFSAPEKHHAPNLEGKPSEELLKPGVTKTWVSYGKSVRTTDTCSIFQCSDIFALRVYMPEDVT